MKKKNGFTLVELLAIIAVLTAIMLLVLPKFSSSVNDRKQKEYNKLIKTIENAGKVYHTYNQGKNKVSINELVKEDLLTSDIKSPIDDTLISGCVFFGKDEKGLNTYTYQKYCNSDGEVKMPEYGKGTTYIKALYDNDVLRAANGLKKDNTSDANIRYEGANPNNYVSFNDELWRIIGVFGDNIKLVRSEELGKLSWDSSDSSINGGWGVNEWSQADLKEYLNKMYYGGTSVTCYVDSYNLTTTCPTGSLNSTSKSMINNYTWNTGAINFEDTTIANQETFALNTVPFYNAERGSVNGKICTSGNYCNDTIERTTTWQGYVALPYATDWAYASSETACATNMRDGYDANHNYDNMTCKKNNWMHHGSTMWMLSPLAISGGAGYVWDVYGVGNVYGDNASYALSVFPSVYLNTEVKITSGSGTSSEPYILEL